MRICSFRIDLSVVLLFASDQKNWHVLKSPLKTCQLDGRTSEALRTFFYRCIRPDLEN
jgi:hypothetical protein